MHESIQNFKKVPTWDRLDVQATEKVSWKDLGVPPTGSRAAAATAASQRSRRGCLRRGCLRRGRFHRERHVERATAAGDEAEPPGARQAAPRSSAGSAQARVESESRGWEQREGEPWTTPGACCCSDSSSASPGDVHRDESAGCSRHLPPDHA